MSILDTARQLTGDGGERRSVYQHPLDDFSATGQVWSGILTKAGLLPAGSVIPAELVAVMMVCLKQVRLAGQPDHIDSIVDTAGYAACHEMVVVERARRESSSPRWGVRCQGGWVRGIGSTPTRDQERALWWPTETEAREWLESDGGVLPVVDCGYTPMQIRS
jgi:hypothetical protein